MGQDPVMGMAKLPLTVATAGTSRVTTVPMLTLAFSPMRALLMMTEDGPI
jgi:hypothetical protein